MAKRLSTGVVHSVPSDLKKTLKTRAKRIRIAGENLAAGKRSPCCWLGCTHR